MFTRKYETKEIIREITQLEKLIFFTRIKLIEDNKETVTVETVMHF